MGGVSFLEASLNRGCIFRYEVPAIDAASSSSKRRLFRFPNTRNEGEEPVKNSSAKKMHARRNKIKRRHLLSRAGADI
jgi:hypothetical protein